MKRIWGSLLILTLAFTSLWAQELKFNIRFNTLALQTVDPQVFTTLEQALNDLLNNQKWTEDVFEPEERINCNLLITLKKENSPTSFEVDLAIQSSRPVYGSEYETPVFNHYDENVAFEYEQFQPMQFNRNNFNNNLVSTLAFYAYMVLGFDYDTFSPLGGERFFLEAQEIINTVPPGAAALYKGWLPSDGQRNRYWLIENVLSPRMRPFRRMMYDYHRQGLDLMAGKPDQARATIMTALMELEKVNQAYPNSMLVPVFSVSKREEIVEIFKRGTAVEQNQLIQLMNKVDPANSSLYRSIR
jgi:hypothetical protein